MGRRDELDHLSRLIDDAAAGVGGSVVIIGEPGAGKTRLVEAAAETAGRTGLIVRVGRAADQELERTLGVALDAFDMLLDELVGPALASRIVLEAGGGAAAAEFLLADRMLEVLERQCAVAPVLLVIEDLHWSDTATLAWLRAVGQRVAALPLALVVTTRQLEPGSAGRRTADALTARQVTLAPLTPIEVSLLARSVLGGAPNAAIAAALDEARGNALLVLAILAAGAEPINPLASRLTELEPAALRMLQAAAVLGARVESAQLAAVIGTPTPQLIALVADAQAAGVLVTDNQSIRFRHELYRSAVLATLSPPAQTLLHLHTARVLARSGADVLDVAEHYARGANPGDQEAVKWMQEAAVAMVASAPAAALRLVDVALGLAGSAPPEGLLLVRVRALAGTGRTTEAELLGRSLLRDDLEASSEGPLRRELAFTAFTQGRLATCIAEMQRCADLSAGAAARARTHGELAFARLMALDHPGARAAGDLAVLEGRCYGDLPAQIAGDTVLCMLDLFGNRTVDAMDRARTIVAQAELPGATEAHAFQPWFVAGLVWLETDDFDRLAATARRGREVATTRGSGWTLPGYDALAAFGDLRRGAFDDAEATARATLGYLEGVDGLGVAVWCHSFVAQALLHHDEIDEAEAHVAAADVWLTRQHERAQLGFEQIQLARAGVLERRGDRAAALGGLRQAWDLFRDTGVRSPLPALGAHLSRLAHSAGDQALLVDTAACCAEAARISGTTSLQAIAQLCAAWRDTDPDRALVAADLAGQSRQAGVLATALADTAALLRERGRLVEADRIAGRAVSCWAALGAFADADACAASSRTGRRVRRRPSFGLPSLTTTEGRVTALVAEGLSNPAIAVTLGISRRTVESHMSAIYRKLEVSSRVALARVALAHGIGGANAASLRRAPRP